MPEPTIADSIITMINSEANNNPAPLKGTIIRTYTGNTSKCDISTENGVFKYVDTIGTVQMNSKGVVVFIDGDSHQPFFITTTAGSGTVVDVVENGNMNAVTSNAVYDAIDTAIGDIENDMNE